MVEVVDIGLDVSRATAHLVDAGDVADVVAPPAAATAHKWNGAVRVVAGSRVDARCRPAVLARRRCAAGPGSSRCPSRVAWRPCRDEVIQPSIGDVDWAAAGARRPLLGTARWWSGPVSAGPRRPIASIRQLIADAMLPVVVDGDALYAVGVERRRPGPLLTAGRDRRSSPRTTASTRCSPGRRPGADRFAAARRLAADLGCTVLLKGPTTVVADPTAEVLVVDRGDERLATAGTGDVLAGMIVTMLASGVEPLRAAAAAAWVHADAARALPRPGLLAGDIVDQLPAHDRRRSPATARTARPMNDLRALGVGGGRSRRGRAQRRCPAGHRRARPRCGRSSRPTGTATARSRSPGPRSRPGREGLCVALVAEGVALREAGIDAPILVLSEQPPDAAAAIVEHRLTPTVYTRRYLDALVGGRARPPARPSQDRHRACSASVRIPHTVAAIVASIEERFPAVELTGVFTHLAVADEPDDPFTATQLARFDDALTPRARRAWRCTSRTRPERWPIPRPRRSFVRAGIAVYGISPGPGVDDLAARPAPGDVAEGAHLAT